MDNISDSMRALLIGISQEEKRREQIAQAKIFEAERKKREATAAAQLEENKNLLFAALENL